RDTQERNGSRDGGATRGGDNGRRGGRATRGGAPLVPKDVRLTVEQAVRRIHDGKAVIVIGDEDREDEGDVVFAAGLATPKPVNSALKHGRGILCAPMAPEEADRMGLRLMVERNTAKFGTPFTESVDARRGTTTGTSAFDRSKTLRALADPGTR